MRSAAAETVARRPASRLEHALALHRAGDVDAAALLYELVLHEHPGDPDARHLLGVARRSQGRTEEAVELVRGSLALAPAHADAWHNLGNALSDLSRFSEAADAFARASELRPDHVGAWYGLGLARSRLDDRQGAIDAYRRALAIDPSHVRSRHNLANQLMEQGDDQTAAAELRRVLGTERELPEAHYNLARALLRLGDYGTGFAEYAWRWRTEGFPDKPRRTDLPVWDGGAVRGRILLVQAEQGLGDTIQMVRLVPLVASLGARVVLEVPDRIHWLLDGFPGSARVVPIGTPVPDAELRIPLFDLPARLRLTLGSIPAVVPYLRPHPAQGNRPNLGLGDDGRLRVGVCWRGNPRSPADAGRSLPHPRALAEALDLDGVRLVALCEPSAHPLEWHPAGLGWRLAEVPTLVEHGGPDLDGGGDAFRDTTQLLSQLDLVVTTDTALAHLAGAMAKPALLLLKASADWRWLAGRTDSPWYPTFELVRQPRPGEWDAVLSAVREKVARAEQRRNRRST